MNYVCEDNRFEIIERYKNELISATNIESSPEEMAVLDDVLFRFWQMGWLKEHEAVKPIRISTNYEQHWKCGNCKAVISVQDKHCHECGKRIEWEGR